MGDQVLGLEVGLVLGCTNLPLCSPGENLTFSLTSVLLAWGYTGQGGVGLLYLGCAGRW